MSAMSEAGDRLRALRVKKGYATASDAAKAFGWNEHTYKSHENGVRGIRPDAARKYAIAYGSSAAHILGIGNGNPQPRDSSPVNQVTEVSLIGKVSAGVFRYDESGEEIGAILVPAVPRKDIPAAAQYALEVDGQSVNKKIPDGAYAICALYDSYPGGAAHGSLVHVIRERAGLREHTIKELHYTRSGALLMPCSTDPRYQEQIKLDSTEDETTVRIHGVVIGTFQPL
jgi:SOS-response transcriptional repressor LexA